MFIWSRTAPRPRWQLGEPNTGAYRPPLDKGGMAVGEQDAHHLLTILAGPSPYQQYIAPAMATSGSTVPKRFLRIVTDVAAQVPEHLRHVFQTSGGTLVGGTIDRWTRTIYVVPAPGLRVETRLEYALHESVHLFAHPHAPQAGSCAPLCIGTFQRTYGTGFGEGATQMITEDIMAAQGISRYYRDRPYEQYTPPVRQLVSIFSLDTIARAYFLGETDALTAAMERRWGQLWRTVAVLTTAQKTDQALNQIKTLERAYIQRLLKPGPKGDFPKSSGPRRYA